MLVQADLFGLGRRTIFSINLSVGLAVIALGWKFITESTAEKAERLDIVGMLLSALTVLLLVFPLTERPTLPRQGEAAGSLLKLLQGPLPGHGKGASRSA